MRASSLIDRFAHFYDARKIFWILLLTGKIKTKKIRYVHGGKQTLVYSRAVHV